MQDMVCKICAIGIDNVINLNDDWLRLRLLWSMGALSIQAKISRKGQIVRNFPQESFQKIQIFEFPKGELFIQNILEIPGRKAIGTVIPFEKFPRIFVFLARLSSISEIREIAVPFVTRVFQKFKLKIFIKWKAPLVLFLCRVKQTTRHFQVIGVVLLLRLF